MIDRKLILSRNFYSDGTCDDIHPLGNEPNFTYILPMLLPMQRIKELALQAGYSKDYLAIGLPSNMEEFAELIIKRCIELCDGNHEHKNHTDTLFGKGVTTGIQLSQEAIKTHFGVK